ANASGSFTPPTNSPLPDSCLSFSTAFPRSPRMISAFQSARSRVLDTRYFFAASIVRAKGSIQGSIQSGRDPLTMIAAPVQGDVDGIPKGSHDREVSHEISIPLLLAAPPPWPLEPR